MKLWSKIGISTVIVCIGIGLYVYSSLNPAHHFGGQVLPVLVVPQASAQLIDKDMNKDIDKVIDKDSKPISTINPLVKKDDSFNVLILGTDAREDENARSDVMMVAHVNPSQKVSNVISIPRDSRVHVDGVGLTKINHAHIVGELRGGNKAGTQLALQAVSDFLNIPIHYYIKTDFRGFQSFIDTIGGVDIDIRQDMFVGNYQIALKQGMQHIDGKLALLLVRERFSLPGGDFDRQKQQSDLLKSVAVKLLQPDRIPEVAYTLAKVRNDILDTNFSDSDLISLAWAFKGIKDESFTYLQIPGSSEYDFDPLVGSQLWYWIPDMVAVKEMIEKYFNS